MANENKKITDYTIIVAESSSTLTYLVNDCIKSNWQPYGSPTSCFNPNNGVMYLCQAMVKTQ